MKKLEAINKLASQLSVEQIRNLSDEDVMSMAMERPGHPGQFGFMLRLQYFKSTEHLAEISTALMKRLQRIEHLKEKMTSATHDRQKVVEFSGDDVIQSL